MALLVIACGLLLMFGGGAALLLGFDIVMTERGSAMTIGGTIALSGGTVAFGIGLALIRLRQILRALESRAARLPRSAGADRPVVPIAAAEPAEPMPDLRPAATAFGAAAAGAGAADWAVRRSAIETPSAAPDEAPAEEPAEETPGPADLEAELARALSDSDELVSTQSFADDLAEAQARDEVAREEAAEASDGDAATATPAAEPPEPEDEPLFADEPSAAVPVAEAPAAPAAEAAQATPTDEPEAPRPAVLGTYNVGGRTYRMFADGSVEAVTEQGIERFASMEELRKHLSSF